MGVQIPYAKKQMWRGKVAIRFPPWAVQKWVDRSDDLYVVLSWKDMPVGLALIIAADLEVNPPKTICGCE